MLNKLKNNPNIICGTTGKIAEIIKKGLIDQTKIGTLIIDEFDY